MRFEFTDKILKDTWIESYNSLDEISDEIKTGCIIAFLFTCEICKKEFKTKNQKEAMIGICKKCRKGGVKNV